MQLIARIQRKIDRYCKMAIRKVLGLVHPAWVAMNNQKRRRALFQDLCDAIPFDAIIETGTWKGNTTAFMHKVTKTIPIHSVELNEQMFRSTQKKLRRIKEITLAQGDSRAFVRHIAETHKYTLPFFYLDAHWNDDLPLWEEVQIIAEHWQRCVIMIDDFQVPNDAGYGYDDYGTGKTLQLEYLKPFYPDAFTAYFPRAKSEQESGAKRGCVVLVPNAPVAKDLRDMCDRIHSLRRHSPENSGE